MSATEQAKGKKEGKAHKTKGGAATVQGGLKFARKLTRVGEHPYEQIDWEFRAASITNDNHHSGCQFASLCPIKTEPCASQDPPLATVAPGRKVRCLVRMKRHD